MQHRAARRRQRRQLHRALDPAGPASDAPRLARQAAQLVVRGGGAVLQPLDGRRLLRHLAVHLLRGASQLWLRGRGRAGCGRPLQAVLRPLPQQPCRSRPPSPSRSRPLPPSQDSLCSWPPATPLPPQCAPAARPACRFPAGFRAGPLLQGAWWQRQPAARWRRRWSGTSRPGAACGAAPQARQETACKRQPAPPPPGRPSPMSVARGPCRAARMASACANSSVRAAASCRGGRARSTRQGGRLLGSRASGLARGQGSEWAVQRVACSRWARRRWWRCSSAAHVAAVGGVVLARQPAHRLLLGAVLQRQVLLLVLCVLAGPAGKPGGTTRGGG